jgi:copper chaperone
MEIKQFKTNINCPSCVAKVTETLNQIAGKDQWQVDTANPSKILSIENQEVSEQEVIASIQAIGYKIARL